MSRSSRTSMGPPPQESIMGPPPLPTQLSQSASGRSKDSQDITEKYRRLKRKYFELEEKHKEAQIQLRSSGERNVKWRAERAHLLDRITELETNPNVNHGAPIPAPPFSAYPRSLLSQQGHTMFINNLQVAIGELEHEDPDVDPLILSRHVGPQARKRQEAEFRERQEEEAREAKRASRRPRAPAKGKDLGTPLTYAPAPVLASAPPPAPGSDHNPSPPILVSSTGTRLRLKPPAPPPSDHDGPTPPPGPHGASQHHSLAAPPHHTRHGSDSPISPIMSPQEGFSQSIPIPAMSPSYPAAPTQSQMQMTLRTSSASSHTTRPSELQRHAKPKRLKAHTVTTRSFSIPMVPRDKKGRPVLPLNVGIMTVVHLGEICPREHFHTERYIFPVGYEVTRRYLSTTDPNAEIVYTCTILDGGDGPKFQIVPSDMPDKPVIAGTATGAWSVIVRAANHIRNRQHSNSVSGPDFFGLGQNTIKHLIQELPHANQLKDYVWQHFVEGGPLGGRHAAVIPALPEESDSAPTYGQFPERGEAEHERPRELQIIHMESEDQGQPRLPAPPSMKPITFHQEYAHPPERELRERRNSRSSNHNHEEYRTPAPRSPTQSFRKTSHSPSVVRDRDHLSPQQLPPSAGPSAHTRSHSRSSPYQTHAMPSHNGSEQGSVSRTYSGQTPPPPVPATFASIMNAYPAPPMASSPPAHDQEYTYSNGRRNGNAERFSERADR